ncbi:MAG: class I SAM-dependent methyltransferase [Chitinispirillaceae bacterium]|nr:class I SAM-dependent methyltransferase [Chitinispirillaceae bacterium]
MADRHRVFPWWMGYLLMGPLRRMRQDPDTILSPYVREGMRALEIGPGMGYFTIPLARIAGENGAVTAVDIQEKMLSSLKKRARRAGVDKRITCVLASPGSLNLGRGGASYDFALAFGVVHELPGHAAFFRELGAALRPGALFLMADPPSRFLQDEYDAALTIAANAGFEKTGEPVIARSRTALLRKTGGR